MLRLISRIVAVLLLGMMLTTPSLGTMAFGLIAAPGAVPGGCHNRGTSVPPPTPVSYKCCATGHQYAIPGTSFSVPTALSYFCRAIQVEQTSRVYTGSISSRILIPFSPGSPGSSFLRI